MHKDLKKIKPTMRIVSRHKVKDTPGIIKGQTVRPLCGAKQVPSERIRVGLAQFKPNLHEHLHWHPIEVFYYVLKGSAVVHDLAGKAYKVGPGDSIYAPAGIAGSHEWHIGKDGLELLSIRATNDGHRRMQFTVNRNTGESVIDMHELGRMDAISFESHY
jgi:quercetin dioxygenase-like cupin family protein